MCVWQTSADECSVASAGWDAATSRSSSATFAALPSTDDWWPRLHQQSMKRVLVSMNRWLLCMLKRHNFFTMQCYANVVLAIEIFSIHLLDAIIIIKWKKTPSKSILIRDVKLDFFRNRWSLCNNRIIIDDRIYNVWVEMKRSDRQTVSLLCYSSGLRAVYS